MLADLIARLEAATGPDRTLDAYTKAAVEGFDPIGKTRTEVKMFTGPAHELVLEYTVSIDAALTLVPEGADVEVYFSPRERPHRRGCVVLTIGRQVYEASAVTPALAVVIAALRARAADGGPR
ncbi:MAG: hypothetical protein IOB84_12595 [Brevundimonas sp.]|nr:hypothetical protein [Brevundimonas sp.]